MHHQRACRRDQEAQGEGSWPPGHRPRVGTTAVQRPEGALVGGVRLGRSSEAGPAPGLGVGAGTHKPLASDVLPIESAWLTLRADGLLKNCQAALRAFAKREPLSI